MAVEKARELLADELKEKDGKVADLKEIIDIREKRIGQLEDYLRKLIMASTYNALVAVGLVKPQDAEEAEAEEPTNEQLEALETAGLDC